MLMKADAAALLVIDVQERLAPVVVNHEQVIDNTQILMKAAVRLAVPVLISEQYPKGLGPTVAEIAALAPANAVIAKVDFSCMGESVYARRFKELGRRQAVIAGIEAHVCVLQTAMNLLADNYQVFIVADAVSSRDSRSAEAAMVRLQAAGAVIVTTEMAVFEWLERAGTPAFKELSALIK